MPNIDSAPVLARPPAPAKRAPKASEGPKTEFAKMARAFVHAGLFSSLEKRRPGRPLDLLYTASGQSFRFLGPELLGVHDMRVLVGLVALGCSDNPCLPARLQPKKTGVVEVGSPPRGERISIRTTYDKLAVEIGHTSSSGSALNSIKASVRRLCATTISVQDTGVSKLQSTEAEPILRELTEKRRRKSLEVTLCAELSASIRGGPGEYLRLDMLEIRAISRDAARLVHMRLHWINPGESRHVGLDKLVSYLNHGEARSDSSPGERESRILKALPQLEAQLNWGVKLAGTSYQVKRPAAPQAREQNIKSQQ